VGMLTQDPMILLLSAPPLVLSLVVHEFAHARTALAFGDATAKHMGRLTLDPLAHLDPIGTLAIIFVGFGWARPVPVNPANLEPRRVGDIMVSLAGPASNFMLALLFASLYRLGSTYGLAELTGNFPRAIQALVERLVVVNVFLCAFNMIPLFPLDGHHILREQMRPDRQHEFMDWQLKYGRFVLLAMIFLPGFVFSRTPGLLEKYPFLDPIRWLGSYALQPFLWIMYA
jgi:Zn-dependent protease